MHSLAYKVHNKMKTTSIYCTCQRGEAQRPIGRRGESRRDRCSITTGGGPETHEEKVSCTESKVRAKCSWQRVSRLRQAERSSVRQKLQTEESHPVSAAKGGG